MPRTSSFGGPVVLVWDGLNTHTSHAMRELVAARDWLTVYRLPPYAPELNPVEPVWSNLKRSLANLVKQDIGQLTALIRTRLRRMTRADYAARRKPGHISKLIAEYFVAECVPAVDCRGQIIRIWRSGLVPARQEPQFAPVLRHSPGNGRQPHRQHPMIAGVFRGAGVLQVRPGRAASAAAGVTGSG